MENRGRGLMDGQEWKKEEGRLGECAPREQQWDNGWKRWNGNMARKEKPKERNPFEEYLKNKNGSRNFWWDGFAFLKGEEQLFKRRTMVVKMTVALQYWWDCPVAHPPPLPATQFAHPFMGDLTTILDSPFWIGLVPQKRQKWWWGNVRGYQIFSLGNCRQSPQNGFLEEGGGNCPLPSSHPRSSI